MKAPMKALPRFAIGLVAACAASAAIAQTKLDISIPWGPTEFHTVNAQNFAKRVAEITGGQVQMTVHAGGALGIKANESVRAIEDGTVAMAEFAGFQNVGEIPLLGIESLPFLVDDYDQLRVMHGFVRPQWEAELAKRGNKVLYVVPWPSQNFFLKKEVKSMDDLKGVRMRTYDRLTAEMVSKLGMVPQQMNNPDIVPALASGRLDAVMTSGTTAAAQKYWEFLKHTYNTNHLWASNFMVIGMGHWNKISAEHRAAIEKLAKEMEPEFWKVSMAEHERRMQQLRDNGMTVQAAPKEMVSRMHEVTRPMWDDFPKRAGPEAAKVLQEYTAKTGKK
ncbi:MAG: TRAP transporter substrate-binding protein [Burkholderiales bacterium]|nr:MAG: TRAP transporter substrate-binding protein [Burkholderiales bacterium]